MMHVFQFLCPYTAVFHFCWSKPTTYFPMRIQNTLRTAHLFQLWTLEGKRCFHWSPWASSEYWGGGGGKSFVGRDGLGLGDFPSPNHTGPHLWRSALGSSYESGNSPEVMFSEMPLNPETVALYSSVWIAFQALFAEGVLLNRQQLSPLPPGWFSKAAEVPKAR